jgi:hypothetical protein
VARRTETTSTGVATTLALAEQVVAKHLDEGVQRPIGIGLTLSVEGDETANTPEPNELWLRLEVGVEEVDGVGDGAVGDVRRRAVRRLGELRVVYDGDIEVECRKHYIRSPGSLLLYCSLALTSLTLDRQAPALLPQRPNEIFRCYRDKRKCCHSASPVGTPYSWQALMDNAYPTKSRFTDLNTSQSVTRHEAIYALLTRLSTDIRGEQTNGPRSGSALPAGTCRSKWWLFAQTLAHFNNLTTSADKLASNLRLRNSLITAQC